MSQYIQTTPQYVVALLSNRTILLMYNNTIGPTAVRSSQFGRYLDSHREGLLT